MIVLLYFSKRNVHRLPPRIIFESRGTSFRSLPLRENNIISSSAVRSSESLAFKSVVPEVSWFGARNAASYLPLGDSRKAHVFLRHAIEESVRSDLTSSTRYVIE